METYNETFKICLIFKTVLEQFNLGCGHVGPRATPPPEQGMFMSSNSNTPPHLNGGAYIQV